MDIVAVLEKEWAASSPVARRLALAVVFPVVACAVASAVGAVLGLSAVRASFIGVAFAIVVAPLAAYAFWSPVARILRSIDDGLRSCREHDYSLRLRSDR